MQIQLDPTRWLVSFAGFVVDWIMTREWKKIAFNSIPLLFLITVAGLVFWGSRLDKHKLAARYLELGEKEIADWESSWAPDRAAEKLAAERTDAEKKAAALTPTSDASKATAEGANQPTPAADAEPKKDDKKELSRFAEVLFRRVQLLEPSERSQFVIAVTMAQRGAIGQSLKMLAKIAPDDRPGFPPAHAWIASNMLRQPIEQAAVPILFHHMNEAVKWDRVPEQILLVNGNRLLQAGKTKEGIELFKRAAEVNPNNYLLLLQTAGQLENPLLAEEASKRGEAIFRSELEKAPFDLMKRLTLVQFLAVSKRLDEAEAVIQAGLDQASSPELTRGLSEVYRLRFLQTMKQEGENWTGDLQLLDQALRIDPANPMIAEEIAKLAKLNKASPGDELIKTLQQFLAEGKATAATHAWIAELHLERKNFKKALPHLEQVVTRLPNAAQYLNNLAYILVDIAPDRLDEALGLAERAVKIESSTPNSAKAADYFDTLSRVLAAKNRTTEAITALESAIERAPMRIEFHEDVAKLYLATGNTAMAEQHVKVIEEIKRRIAQAEKAAAEKAAAEQAAIDQAAVEKAAAEIPAEQPPAPETPPETPPTEPNPGN